MTTVHHFDPPGPSPGLGIVPAEMVWYGKKAPGYCAPLTVEWFAAAMEPRFNEIGEKSYVLTPPKRDKFGWAGVAMFIIAAGGAVVWASHVFGR